MFNPIFYILYSISYILYPIFYILYSISYILYPIFYILYSISYILYPIFYILYSISYMLSIGHPKALVFNDQLAIFQTLSHEFHQNAFESICSEHSKLITYAAFETKIGFETYFTKIKHPATKPNLDCLIAILRLRLVRHKQIPRESRFCPFCCNMIEAELHFLLICHIHAELRTKVIMKPPNSVHLRGRSALYLKINGNV